MRMIACIINIFFAAGNVEEGLLVEKNWVLYISRNMQENQILQDQNTVW